MDKEVRDWRPGDGLRCTYWRRAPEGIPCGPPVTTVLKTITGVRRRDSIKRVVLCANHGPQGIASYEVTVEAKRYATERVLTEHWEDYQRYLGDEIRRIVADRETDSDG